MTGDGLGEGYGMLGQAGSGKLRVSIGQSKLAAKVTKKSVSHFGLQLYYYYYYYLFIFFWPCC
jgi:hypothetical protein